MIINTALIRGLPNKDLGKIVLFCIEQDIKMDMLMEVNDIDLYQKTLLLLLKENIIDRTVENHCGYKLNYPLYVENVEEFNEDIQEFKDYFYIRSCGMPNRNSPPKDIKNALSTFMSLNPEYTWEDIIGATKLMYEYNKDKDSMPKDYNFIVNTEGNCLLVWLDQYKNQGVKTANKKLI